MLLGLCKVSIYFAPLEPFSYSVPVDLLLFNDEKALTHSLTTHTHIRTSSKSKSVSDVKHNKQSEDESVKSYVRFHLRGKGTYPMLSFNMREVVLPITPLGVSARKIFYIHNKGYENLELRYSLPHTDPHMNAQTQRQTAHSSVQNSPQRSARSGQSTRRSGRSTRREPKSRKSKAYPLSLR